MIPYLIILALTTISIVIKVERNKTKRIDKLKELDDSKIESIGNYEKKSKGKYYLLPFSKRMEDS